ncbi:hypothetical protein [Novosphingobium sp. TH158]|uniref:hypothetical protein n=1 Tax=Novosphingobium sp. TH158 TaxID=2067455 RepID=UPI000C7E3F59|nr:hypothetical protein [Novosphingobium sp. TH158]PLK26017.1 hypothetical protein C0V78_03295 [Novosphingobium sp. TH158]
MKELLESIPVPPKMYRHFAVITVVITACIAVFADGERREAIGAELKAEQQQAALRQAEADTLGPRKIHLEPSPKASTGSGFGTEGPVDPGGENLGAPEPMPTRGTATRINPYAASSMPPGFVPGARKLPGPSVGPAWKRPVQQPTAADLEKIRRAGEERGGAATPANQ